jgi:group I intron endonuclease
MLYQIKNTENGKCYIGSTKNWNRRKYLHKYALENDKHINNHLQNAWNKYGSESFEFEVIRETENQFEEEQKMLDEADWSKLYNISKEAKGGDIFTDLSEKEKQRFKEKSKHVGEENGMYGKTHSEQAKRKMKFQAENRYTLEWFIERYGEEEGKWKYEKRCQRLSERDWDNPMNKEKYRQKISESLSGQEKSEEHKKKISEARKGKVTGEDNPRYKEVPKEELKRIVKQSDMNFGEIAKHFEVSGNCLRQKMKDYFGKTYTEMK